MNVCYETIIIVYQLYEVQIGSPISCKENKRYNQLDLNTPRTTFKQIARTELYCRYSIITNT